MGVGLFIYAAVIGEASKNKNLKPEFWRFFPLFLWMPKITQDSSLPAPSNLTTLGKKKLLLGSTFPLFLHFAKGSTVQFPPILKLSIFSESKCVTHLTDYPPICSTVFRKQCSLGSTQQHAQLE